MVRIRFDRIQLSWFRGAAQNVTLELNSKNIVVYGTNASGKSSFVDAVEYLFMDGRIRHLSHEYSGRRQEKGIRNTHTPEGTKSKCAIYFDDGSFVLAEIEPDGAFTINSDPPNLKSRVQSWALENHILRQDEVSQFITLRKGKKYSVLLPLLGLENLENAAKNLKKLKVQVVEQSEVERKKNEFNLLKEKANKYFPSLEEGEIYKRLCELSSRYLDTTPADDIPTLVKQLSEAIKKRIDSMEAENKRFILLKQILEEELDTKLDNMISTSTKAEDRIDTLLDCRIAVLEPSLAFTDALENLDEEVECPSCGQIVIGRDLADHVTRELDTLSEARTLRDAVKKTCDQLSTALNRTVEKTRDTRIASWLELDDQKECAEAVKQLASIRLTEPDARWKKDDLTILRNTIPRLIEVFTREVGEAPPSIQELIEDREFIEVGATVPKILELQEDIKRVEMLLSALETGERLVRDEIKSRIDNIIQGISTKIQQLWLKLHPNEPIEEVHLHIPSETDKAIDIALKFFGVDQPSPRLTLSESHRNCLGLCIFLALALLRADQDHPIILDDIVSSLDREHRERLVDLFLDDLADCQVILFTHDREWYAELRFRLPAAEWNFMALRPWENPSIGLQWSRSRSTFDDARTLLPIDPEACGNRVRAIMDTHLAIAAEKLRIRMPYLRGDRNDRRTCVYFLNRIIGKASRRLQKKQGNSWLPYSDPISDWEEARNLLIAWGDRASHGGSLTVSEAERLIDICVIALDHFKCPTCNDYIWIAEQSSRERVQCACGEFRWKYG